LFVTVLEIVRYMVKVLADLTSGKGLISGLQIASFLLYPHMIWGKRETQGENMRQAGLFLC
jgi:hypothetical protein